MNLALKVKSYINQILGSYFVYIRHFPSASSFAYLSENQTIQFGSGKQNDLVLIGPGIQEVEGKWSFVDRKSQYRKVPGASSEIQKGKVWVGGYRLSIHRTVHWFVAAVALLLMTASVLFGGGKAIEGPSQLQRYELPARDTYGNLIFDQVKVHSLIFAFKAEQSQAYTMLYTPGNIDGNQDLEIKLNGQNIGYVESCLSHWAREQRLYIPADKVQVGENEITFHYHGNLETAWGIRNLYVQPTQKNSNLVPEKVFDIAQKLYIERHAKPGNLLRAKKMMEKLARHHRSSDIALSDKQEELFQQINSDLDLLQGRILRDARILVRNGNLRKAGYYYKRLLQELIDPMDPKRFEITNEMYEVGVM